MQWVGSYAGMRCEINGSVANAVACGHRSGFGIQPRQMVEWRSYWQLDDALLGNAAALEEAARTLPGGAVDFPPFLCIPLQVQYCQALALNRKCH